MMEAWDRRIAIPIARAIGQDKPLVSFSDARKSTRGAA